MTYYTGYFAQLKKYEKAGLFPVSIALYHPIWFTGVRISKFAPPSRTLGKYKRGMITPQEYEKEYFESLDKENDHIIMTLHQLEVLSKGKDIILLCYEKPTKFCHRHLFADYCKRKYDIEITEFEV